MASPVANSGSFLNQNPLDFKSQATDQFEVNLRSADSLSKKTLAPFGNVKPREAEKIIALAARQFGLEAAYTAMDALKSCFHSVTRLEVSGGKWEEIYPYSQLRVLKFMTDEFQSSETSLKTLESLGFYQVKDEEDKLLSVYNDEGVHLGKIHCDSWEQIFVLPITLLGKRFGKETAQKVERLARQHMSIRHYQHAIKRKISEFNSQKMIRDKVAEKPLLHPADAFELIEKAGKEYGKEMAEWYLEHLRDAFNRTTCHFGLASPFNHFVEDDRPVYTTRHIYLQEQLKTFKFFAEEYKCPKTALKALKTLRLYDLPEEDEIRHQQDVGDSMSRLNLLLEPICIMGTKFGKEHAEKTFALSLSHCDMKNYSETPEGKERTDCLFKTFTSKEEASSCVIS
jgi:hypothetical protein